MAPEAAAMTNSHPGDRFRRHDRRGDDRPLPPAGGRRRASLAGEVGAADRAAAAPDAEGDRGWLSSSLRFFRRQPAGAAGRDDGSDDRDGDGASEEERAEKQRQRPRGGGDVRGGGGRGEGEGHPGEMKQWQRRWVAQRRSSASLPLGADAIEELQDPSPRPPPPVAEAPREEEEEEEGEFGRRPSLPTSIHECDFGGGYNEGGSGSGEGGGYGGGGAFSSASSVVSEVTLMTYSDEKAELVKAEFFRRLKVLQRRKEEELTVPEKEELLRAVQAELEERCNAEREEQRRLRREAREEAERGLRGRIERAKERGRGSAELEADAPPVNEWNLLNDLGAEMRPLSGVASPPPHPHPPVTTVIPTKMFWSNRRGSVESVQTVKQGNNRNRRTTPKGNWAPPVAEVGDDAPASAPTPGGAGLDHILGLVRRQHPSHQGEAPQDARSSPAFAEGFGGREEKKIDSSHDEDESERRERDRREQEHIEAIIELKLLVAEQRTTIDNLSSRLHDLEKKKEGKGASATRRRPSNSDAEYLKRRNRDLTHENDALRRELRELRLGASSNAATVPPAPRPLSRKNSTNSGASGSRRTSVETQVTEQSTFAESAAVTL